METLQELLVEEIRDIYDAEKQIVRALPKFAKAASDSGLKQAFSEHVAVTREHVQRIEKVFEMLGQKARSKPCKGMKGLLEEGQEVLSEDATDEILDSAMIGAAQRVEHYEISAYGTARALAKTLGMKDVVQLLEQTLREEEQTDKQLTQIALKIQKETSKSEASSRKEAAASQSGSGAASRKSTSGNSRGTAAKTSARSGAGTKSSGQSGSRTTTDHEEIQRWAEERGGKPASVRGTGGKKDTGMIRLDFPGYSGGESLEEISWDEFFEKFEESGLALLYQEKTSGGQKSNFNKLVARGTTSGKRSHR